MANPFNRARPVPLEREWDRYYLEMGTWKNPHAAVRMNTRFWGRNIDWINARWDAWRSRCLAKSA